MPSYQLADHMIFALSGEGRAEFLQGIMAANIGLLASDRGLYSCLLNPQGKILFDFFLYQAAEAILLDVHVDKAPELLKKLKLYKLRAKVEIQEKPELSVLVGWDGAGRPEQPLAVVADPRSKTMGWRAVVASDEGAKDDGTYDARRIELGLPETKDYVEDRAYPAEYGLEDLGAVSATKGCYVGQEVVARMRSRGTAKRRLYKVEAKTPLPPLGAVITQGEKEVGQLRSVSGLLGLAILRIDAAESGDMLKAENVEVSLRSEC